MQRSSESIGTIAAALAKAQAQLVNPEKSLVGTIRPDVPGAIERSFRDAPLSSGLDIVRKTLSQHEIAYCVMAAPSGCLFDQALSESHQVIRHPLARLPPCFVGIRSGRRGVHR